MGPERLKAVEAARKPHRRRRKRGSTRETDSTSEGGSPLLGLQSSAGNAAVSRLVEGEVQRQTAVTAAPEATDRPLLKGGEESDQVAQLRMELNVAGTDPQLPPGRVYDEVAIEAVKKFQAKHGLQADGQAGPKTWGMLDAIARDRVPDQDSMNDLREKAAAADKLYEAGDYDAARTLYRSIYRTTTLPPEIRDQFTWNWAACEHQLGNFDLALSLYQEYLTNPGRSTRDQRDTLQRMRECRSHLPPRPTESSVTQDREKALAAG
jgi:hypothetical protein